METNQQSNDYKVEINKLLLDALGKHRATATDKIDWSSAVSAIAALYHQLHKAKVPWRLTKDICLITWRRFLPK